MSVALLIAKGPDFIQDYLVSQKEAELKNSKVNWLGIAGKCDMKASSEFKTDNIDKGIKWTLASIKIYEHLSNLSSNDYTKLGFEISLVRAKVNAIRYLKSDDELFNIQSVENWFFSYVHESREAVQNKLNDWPKLPNEEILKLRNIKNMLNAIEPVFTSEFHRLSPEIKSWFKLKNKLP